MTIPSFVLEVDWSNDGDWGDANEDITGDTWDVETFRGRDHASQLTGRSVAGSLVATLDNTDGKYSPLNTGSPLSGKLVPNRKVRLRATAPTAATLWTGYLTRIVPGRIADGAPIATLEAHGSLGWVAGRKTTPTGSGGATTDTHITTILDDIGFPAGDRTIATGQSTTGRWHVEDRQALNALREIEETELGFIFEDLAGKVVFEDRHHRLKSDHLSSQATYSDAGAAALSYGAIEQADPLREIFNEIRATVQTYSVASAAVLWTLTGETPTLVAGESRSWWAKYPSTDTPGGAYVEAWTTPVVGTDITQTGVANGDIGVSVSKFANAMQITITNNHASDTATLTLIQAKGTAVTRDNPIWVVAEDATSKTAYGERSFRLPGKYYASSDDAQGAVDYIISRYKDPLAVLTIVLSGNRDDAHLAQCVSREIGDRITVVAENRAELGIDEDFFVESISHRIGRGRSMVTTFTCAPASGDEGYFILDTSELDTGKLAY